MEKAVRAWGREPTCAITIYRMVKAQRPVVEPAGGALP